MILSDRKWFTTTEDQTSVLPVREWWKSISELVVEFGKNSDLKSIQNSNSDREWKVND